MPLKDYTTSVPVGRTIGQISGLLVEAGARRVMTEYDDHGLPQGMGFTIQTPYGEQAFHLPVHPAKVKAVLLRDRVAPHYSTDEHAARVAWRILRDWIDAQVAIVRTEMVTLDQVMLPYAHAGDGSTVYELYQASQLKALEAGS